MLNTKALAASASAAKVYVEDVFSTYLYTGTASSQTITNGIDLAGEGGLVWIKQRDGAGSNLLTDTARGTDKFLVTDDTIAQTSGTGWGVLGFSSTGFTAPPLAGLRASWTFRKAEKFFDVVTYTGDGAGQGERAVSHNLQSSPGCIIIKRTDSTSSWAVWHRFAGVTNEDLSGISLNATTAAQGYPNGTTALMNSSSFDPANIYGADFGTCNTNGATYVAYLFAHDAGGFGDSGDDSVVKCGTYAGNGSTSGPTIDLGWEPQWLLIKKSSGPGNWWLIDNMRGLSPGGSSYLEAQNSGAEASSSNAFILRPNGFQITTNDSSFNSAGDFIYIAIRRGPMKTPTSGTEVFSASYATASTPAIATGFPVDLGIVKATTGGGGNLSSRLIQGKRLLTGSTGDESNNSSYAFDFQDGWFSTSLSSLYISWNFRRAPGFFDVVAYTGTGSARTVSHNLGVVPELMIVKGRTTPGASIPWTIYHASLGPTKFLGFDTSNADSISSIWNDQSPSISTFTVGSAGYTNVSGGTYIAYLFATLPGVSKVGSYTGTGTTLDIDCGFTSGARFVLIKRTDSTGDWFVWDTARGIVSGNDPYLLLSSIAAEVTNTDYIDPLSSGFQISSTAPAAINASGGSFIFLAIA
jgi:hypothetical protein